MCDSRLAGFIIEHLGVSFFKRRKYPIAVDINNKRGKELKEEVDFLHRFVFNVMSVKGEIGVLQQTQESLTSEWTKAGVDT